MNKILNLDLSGLFSVALELAVPSKITQESQNKVLETFAQWTEKKQNSEIYSAYREETIARSGFDQSLRLAQNLRSKFSTLVVLGIGGSALGARTGISALDWSLPEKDRRRIFILDNLDPIYFERAWSSLDLKQSLFAVISKSGSTLESIAQFSVIVERLEAQNLSLTEHLVVITDPEKGALKTWAEALNVESLPIPSQVGGRFSVLSPVGIFPMAFAGLDVEGLVQGAQAAYQEKIYSLDKVSQLAQRLCELEEAGYFAHVLMPYATIFKDFALWFVQLWGESLGKNRLPLSRRQDPIGPVPLAAVGATDQHSLLQLLVEGKARHITGFIGVDHWPPFASRQPIMCKVPAEFASLSYAYGKSFGDILNAEMKATRTVLEERGRPLYQISLQNPSPQSLGALFAFYMDLVSLTAAASEVNPYDQPGVEFGKKILPNLLK